MQCARLKLLFSTFPQPRRASFRALEHGIHNNITTPPEPTSIDGAVSGDAGQRNSDFLRTDPDKHGPPKTQPTNTQARTPVHEPDAHYPCSTKREQAKIWAVKFLLGRPRSGPFGQSIPVRHNNQLIRDYWQVLGVPTIQAQHVGGRWSACGEVLSDLSIKLPAKDCSDRDVLGV